MMSHEAYYETFMWNERTFIATGVVDFFNKRIRVDSYRGNVEAIIKKVEENALHHNIEKIIIKARNEHMATFLAKAYTVEAVIDGYFSGSTMFFMTKYRKIERRNSVYWLEGDVILEEMKEKVTTLPQLSNDYHIRVATEKDVVSLAELFKEVFQIYPTPLYDSSYIEEEMTDTLFYVAEHKGKIVSVASAEMNRIDCNAELTNCATINSHRKAGLMKILLNKLEEELRQRHIYCAYTIARSLSFGMNCAFYQLGYTYTGRLTNNCYIYDKLEDMNVWVKNISNE